LSVGCPFAANTILVVATDHRDAYVALLAFTTGGDAGVLVVAPAPNAVEKRWCRWTQGPRLGPSGLDDVERLSLVMMRVGYAMGVADSFAGRDRDLIGGSWVERTLPRVLEPVGLKVTATVALGPMTEADVAEDRALLWERVRAAHRDSVAVRDAAMAQLADALKEMGGMEMDFDFSDLPRADVQGVPQVGAARSQGTAA
jgi:hypothetical protein